MPNDVTSDMTANVTSASAALAMGLRAYLEGDFADAVFKADAAIESPDLSEIAHYLKALIALERGDEAAARDELRASSENEDLAVAARRVLAGLDAAEADRVRRGESEEGRDHEGREPEATAASE